MAQMQTAVVRQNKELARGIVAGIHAGRNIMADGKVDFNDIFQNYGAIAPVSAAVEGISETDDEARTMDTTGLDSILSEYDALRVSEDPVNNALIQNSLKGAHCGFLLTARLSGREGVVA